MIKTTILAAAFASAAIGLALPAQEAGGVSVEENVTYAPDLTLDVYQPTDRGTKPRAAIVLIHGGGWTSLDKGTMRGMGNFLARNGYVAFSVEYRLFNGTSNKWPAQLEDVERAVRWVRANAAKYNVNPKKIGAFGHSAGAQLAALLGMVDATNRVQATVVVSGPSDLMSEADKDNVAFLKAFMGSDSARRSASPVFRAAKGDAPVLIVHGTQDPDVPIAQAQELADTLQARGVSVSFVKIEGGAHTFDAAGRRQLAIESLAFFNRYLAEDQ